MTVYSLIENYNKHHPDGHFFDDNTLRFFGERVSEMRVLKKTETITTYRGRKHECYCLSSLQRKAPGGARRAYHYFDVETFDSIIPKEDWD